MSMDLREVKQQHVGSALCQHAIITYTHPTSFEVMSDINLSVLFFFRSIWWLSLTMKGYVV